LRDLNKILAAVPLPPKKRPRGRPTNKNLYDLVQRLANYWELTTGDQFTQNWLKGKPIPLATQFVYAVVHFVDPKSLGSLPNSDRKCR
jgi:hypothetical protein